MQSSLETCRQLSHACLRLAAGLTLTIAFAEPSLAQAPPAINDVPPGVATAHPDLARLHDMLVSERKSLNVDLRAFNAKCAKVTDASVDAQCRKSMESLSAASNTHVKKTNDYNNALAAATGRDECVRAAAKRLKADVAECQSKIVECLKTAGVQTEAAVCTASALIAEMDYAKTLVLGAATSCGNRAYEIANDCAPTWGSCPEKPLRSHDAAVKACPAK